jgi:LPS-assembly lipoprotein
MNLPLRASVPLLAAAAAAGCGFHLQGTATLPESMSTTYVATPDRFTTYYDALTDQLRSRGIEVVEEPVEGAATLRVLADEAGERVLSVSARNIPREFEVYYVVEFALSLPGGGGLEPQRIVSTRNYTWDETRVLGKSEEERRLTEDLAGELASRTLRRLDVAEPP